MSLVKETNEVTISQVVRANKTARRNGLYLVKRNGKTIGSIAKRYHENTFVIGEQLTTLTFSNLKSAVTNLVRLNEREIGVRIKAPLTIIKTETRAQRWSRCQGI